MRRSLAPALLAMVLGALPGPAGAADPACKGTLSGSVTGKFDCEVAVTAGDENRVYLVIMAKTQVDGVPGLVPGSFDVTDQLKPGTYELGDLGMGRASVAADGGTLYTATKTTGQRGEVNLVLSKVKKSTKVKGAWEVHGTYRARLIPAGGGKTGEVVVDVKF